LLLVFLSKGVGGRRGRALGFEWVKVVLKVHEGLVEREVAAFAYLLKLIFP
jgi:hypothetical protein